MYLPCKHDHMSLILHQYIESQLSTMVSGPRPEIIKRLRAETKRSKTNQEIANTKKAPPRLSEKVQTFILAKLIFILLTSFKRKTSVISHGNLKVKISKKSEPAKQFLGYHKSVPN